MFKSPADLKRKEILLAGIKSYSWNYALEELANPYKIPDSIKPKSPISVVLLEKAPDLVLSWSELLLYHRAQWHPVIDHHAPKGAKHLSLPSLHDCVFSVQCALHSMLLPAGTTVYEYRTIRDVQSKIQYHTAPWPSREAPVTLEKMLQEPDQFPPQKKLQYFNLLFNVKEPSPFQEGEEFETVVYYLISYCQNIKGVAFEPSELPSICEYFKARQQGIQLEKSIATIQDADRVLIIRYMWLLQLFQQAFSQLCHANKLFGYPIKAIPPPQKLFDGLTWQVALLNHSFPKLDNWQSCLGHSISPSSTATQSSTPH